MLTLKPGGSLTTRYLAACYRLSCRKRGARAMKIRKKKILIVLCLIFILVGLCFGIIKSISTSEMEAVAMEQKMAYTQVNYAFLLADDDTRTNSEVDIEKNGIFMPFPEVDLERNRFDIIVDVYILLLMYEAATGKELTYETVLDYFSKEYEQDGSLRLHNNGKHPEINEFVEWMWEESRWRREIGEFIVSMASYLGFYIALNPDFERIYFYALSPQMLTELAKTVINPERSADDMNLTELQKAGY